MAKHTSIEVIKSLKLGEGIYQNISVSGDILQLPGIRYNLTDHQWEYNNQSEIDNKWKPFGSGTNKSFIVIDIEYGINGKNYLWENNILTIQHNLNTQIPTVYSYVRLNEENNNQYELAIIPHSFIKDNYNQIQFDCERI